MPKKSYKPPEEKSSSVEHTYRPAWESRVLELRRLSDQAQAKLELAQKIATIADCTLVKTREEEDSVMTDTPNAHASNNAPPKLQRITILQMTINRLGKWQGDIYANICKHAGVSVGFHPHQLHMEEYAALRTLEMVSNINFQLLVAKEPCRVEKEKSTKRAMKMKTF